MSFYRRPGFRLKLAGVLLALLVLAAGWAALTDFSPLHAAIAGGNVTAVRMLLVVADPNRPDGSGWRPLHLAAATDRPEMIRLLLGHGADIEAGFGPGGEPTPLCMASWRTDTGFGAMKALLAAGARPTDNALLCAVSSRDPRKVPLLLAAGANPNARLAGRPALIKAAWVGSPGLAPLLAAGADPNARDRDGRTALHFTADRGDAAAVELLLAKGARPNLRDDAGATPLRVAADRQTAAVLVAAGADVNARSADGWTPLMRAAQRGDAEWVQLLLAAGADPSPATPAGWTAVRLASARGDEAVCRLLR